MLRFWDNFPLCSSGLCFVPFLSDNFLLPLDALLSMFIIFGVHPARVTLSLSCSCVSPRCVCSPIPRMCLAPRPLIYPHTRIRFALVSTGFPFAFEHAFFIFLSHGYGCLDTCLHLHTVLHTFISLFNPASQIRCIHRPYLHHPSLLVLTAWLCAPRLALALALLGSANLM